MKTPVIKIQLDIKRLAGQALTKGLYPCHSHEDDAAYRRLELERYATTNRLNLAKSKSILIADFYYNQMKLV